MRQKYMIFFLLFTLSSFLLLIFITTRRDATETSEKALRDMGMQTEVLEKLKEEGINPRILALAVGPYRRRISNLSGETLKKIHEQGKRLLKQALDYRGMSLGKIPNLSNKELKEIYRYYKDKDLELSRKFAFYSTTPWEAEESIFTYRNSKVISSIAVKELTKEQKRYLELIKKHLEFAEGMMDIADETKIIIKSDHEAMAIFFYERFPDGGPNTKMRFVIEDKTGHIFAVMVANY